MRSFMKRRGFTDRLYFLNLKFTWGFTVACFVLTIFSGLLGITDMSVVSVGLPVVWAELGVHTGFVIWKAKAENKLKYNKEIELFDLKEE